MCRILAIKNFYKEKHQYIIDSFIKLAEKGKVPKGNTPGHLDGWGMGYYIENKSKIYKSGKSILEEINILQENLLELKHSRILLFHLRKSAWENTNSIDNSHPFKYKNLIFCHNGTIKNYEKLSHYIKLNNIPLQKKLDSEIFFYLIASNFIKNKDIVVSIFEAINTIKQECNYTSLTSITSDGKNLYIYRDYTKEPDYYTLYITKYKSSTIVCSEIIDENLKWELLKEKIIKVI
ncbi:MAG: class II glutamine amidotransferase [Endomicrobia bacterium]|nr:class II glutamine amidotransferase [Endomicrobiia bacterium]